MELGPILRALWHNKTRFWLITLEVALTLAIVVNCTTMISDFRGRFNRPTGLDEAHLLAVTAEPFGKAYQEEEFVDTILEDDLRLLRSLPGVRAAAAVSHFPLSGSGSSTSRRPTGSQLDLVGVPIYSVSEQALQTYGVELVAGRDFTTSDFPDDNDTGSDGDEDQVRNVIVTQDLADRLFPDGNAIGQTIGDDDDETTETIVGIIRRMHCSWPGSPLVERVMLIPRTTGSERYLRYLVRAEPGAIDSLYAALESQLLEVDAERIVTVRTMGELKRRTFTDTLLIIKILAAVIVLLVMVTSLGIIGLTSLSVAQRTRQIGTRRALGATRVAIARYFVTESWMITGFGLSIGTVLAYGLNYTLVTLADAPKIDLTLLLAATAGLWLAGILAALAPALRATTVAPEIATRTVW